MITPTTAPHPESPLPGAALHDAPAGLRSDPIEEARAILADTAHHGERDIIRACEIIARDTPDPDEADEATALLRCYEVPF